LGKTDEHGVQLTKDSKNNQRGMMKDFLYHYDIYFFSIIIVSITLYSTYKNTKYKNITDKIFALLGLIIIITLIAEMFGWLIDKTNFPNAIWLNFFINTILYAITPLNPLLLTVYYNSIIFTYTKYTKIWLLFLVPIIINFILVFLNFFNRIYFYVDESNTFHRTNLFYIMDIICYSYALFYILYPFINRKHIKRTDFFVFLVLGLFPVLGGILQSIYYGIGLIWPMVSITYLGYHLIIQQSVITKDYLTGIRNRGSLDFELENMIIATKTKAMSFWGLMFDLDYFKKVNDIYGHNEGDILLKEFSTILSNTFRRSECIARFGGDEFMVLIQNCDSLDINNLLDRLKENINTFNETTKKPWHIAYSCGVLDFTPQSTFDHQSFYKEIDRQLYINKNRNKRN